MDLIGKKIRGFKFESKLPLEYIHEMDPYVGEIGVITEVDTHVARVVFENRYWFYPLPLALEYLVEKEPIIPELEGVEMEVSAENTHNKEYVKQIFFAGIKITGEGWNGEYAEGNHPNIEEVFNEEFENWFDKFKKK